MKIRYSMDRGSPNHVVDLDISQPDPDRAIVLYEEDGAENVASEGVDGESPGRRPIKIDPREALFVLHDIAVWRR